ncbi:hypothetical protein A5784_26280 [Mycobacterium sp. 852013-50091_SCH5140682]|uniref:DUF5642 family protein n=1 Tax=Mycobacterium sp. 852013-50091_SCH5140682 TaxID=1834109 RepID=UPI0007EC1C29|nr:DUF5642 family protein [Mycobacterium sp. 852013-50091_SCH5140682]OBC16335.1 hypothetical protein A5784_26280 [Mycobacterium sp. 852013-50091_SCH5140682]
MGSRVAACVVAGCTAVVAVVGCSPSSHDAAPTTTTAKAADYDISRLESLKDKFPQGYTAQWFALRRLDERQAESVSDVVGYGDPVTVEPQACAVLLKPIHAGAGTESVAFRADGPSGQQLSVAAQQTTDPFSVDIPSADCDRLSFTAEDPRGTGTAERLSAPTIDGATTAAVKSRVDGGPGVVDYTYYALVGDRIIVSVHERTDENSRPQQDLSDLLTHAVAAVKAS